MSYRVSAWGRRHAWDVTRMVAEAAKILGDSDALSITPERLLADGFGPHPKFGCLVAEAAGEEGRAVGMLLHHFSFCTWRGRVLCGQELYVEPPHRGRGVGRALVENAAKVAVSHGCSQLRLMVPGGRGPWGLLTHLGASDVTHVPSGDGWAVWHVPPPGWPPSSAPPRDPPFKKITPPPKKKSHENSPPTPQRME